MSAGGQDCTPGRGVSTLCDHTAGRALARRERLPLYRARGLLSASKPVRTLRKIDGRSTGVGHGSAGALPSAGGLGGPVEAPHLFRRKSERADEALDPLVVGLERVLAEDRLALRIVELQVDPVDAIVLALQVRLPDELTAQPRPGGLWRHVLGLLDRLVVGDPVHVVVTDEAVVDALVGPDVVILEVQQRHLRVTPGEAVTVHE